MSINHMNEVRAIARAAQQIGATLPKPLADGLAHLDAIRTEAAPRLRPAALAKELAEHLGDPAGLAKARKAAAAQLATAAADADIAAYLPEVMGAPLRGMMTGVTEAFGEALTADLETLADTAGRLPHWFKPEQAGNLDPSPSRHGPPRDAYARITATENALAPLYGGAADSIHFPTAAAASLRFATPGDLSDHHAAYEFRGALMGRVERPQGSARVPSGTTASSSPPRSHMRAPRSSGRHLARSPDGRRSSSPRCSRSPTRSARPPTSCRSRENTAGGGPYAAPPAPLGTGGYPPFPFFPQTGGRPSMPTHGHISALVRLLSPRLSETPGG